MNFQALTLYTSRMAQQCRFYSEVLGLEVMKVSDDSYRFRLGNTFVRLQSSSSAVPYHFAINIPSNQAQLALEWLKDRLEIISFEGHEIQDFKNWNAEAIYFYDEDKNIVEFIARHNLSNPSDQAFGSQSLLEVSEIGIPTDNIESKFKLLQEHLGVEIYSGSFERFCAIGDERGLFICIDKNKKDWFPNNDKAHSAQFEALVSDGQNSFSIIYKDDKLEIFT